MKTEVGKSGKLRVLGGRKITSFNGKISGKITSFQLEMVQGHSKQAKTCLELGVALSYQLELLHSLIKKFRVGPHTPPFS